MKKAMIPVAALAMAGVFAIGSPAQARSSWGFGFSTGPAHYPAPVYYAPPPVIVAPPPVVVAPRPVYVAPRPCYRPAYAPASFSFSYHRR